MSVAAALLSVAWLPAAPSYDPWAWLIWGRELWSFDLSTAEGPAFKPLPVFACALLAPLGDAAPDAWVVVARAGAVTALLLAGALAWRLTRPAHGPRIALLAAVLAGLAVLLTAGFVRLSAAGSSEGLLLALALGALLAAADRRPRLALALAAGCCLLRVEAWPFALLAVAWRWRAASPGERAALAAGVVAVPVLWFGPEWLGSGDPLRSGDRARVPNPGQPALADVPAWASLRQAAPLVFWPVLLGLVALAARGRPVARAAAPAALGLAWVGLVAVMAQAGFSGEPRYALPGVALIAISGAAGLAGALPGRAGTAGLAVLVLVVGVAAVPRVEGLGRDRAALAYQATMQRDLARAVAAAGGPAVLARCGRPVTGRYRGPLVAWHLDVEKRRVAFAPRTAGVVLASALTASAPVEPEVAPAKELARAGTWTIRARSCASERKS